MRRLFVVCVLGLLGCSGGGGGNPDGGGGGEGGTGGTCTATAMPSILVADWSKNGSLTLVGQDMYWIDFTLGVPLIGTAKGGVIRHMKTDGTGLETVVTPTAVLFGAYAIGSDIFYFQEDDAMSSKVHMYKAPRAGGMGVQVGTATYNGFGAALINAAISFGVFAQRGNDVFVNEGKEVSRVDVTAGTKTVIANTDGIMWPILDGTSTVRYTALVDGATYSVSADAMMPSSVRVGTQTCGMVRSVWASGYSNGWVCGDLFGIKRLDLMASMKTVFIDTLMNKNPQGFNPSPVDGTTFYAMPRGFKAGVIVPIYKLDANTGGPTAVTCDAGAVIDVKVSSSDLVWVEQRQASNSAPVETSLRRLPR